MNYLCSKYKNFILLALIIAIVLPKWIIGHAIYDLNLNVNLITNFDDIQYFPLIVNLSNLDFGQSYIESISQVKIFAVPITPLILHAIFFKFGGLVGLIILEIILQVALVILLFKVIEKVFNSKEISFLFCFIIFSLVIFVYYFSNINLFSSIFGHLEGFFGSRTPRPIFSSLFLFLFFYSALIFKEKINNDIKLKDLLLLSFSLGMLLNSFVFYFVNSFILILILFFIIKKKQSINFIISNIKKILFFSFFLIIFSSPFILQFIFKEEEHAIRMGLFSIDFEQKIFFIKQYIFKLFRPEVISTILLCLFIFLLSNFKFKNNDIDKINLFFYFFISSIISPVIFVLCTTKAISLNHFILIAQFAAFFYLACLFTFVFFKILNNKKILYLLINNYFITIILFLLAAMNIQSMNIKLEKKINSMENYSKIENYLSNNNIQNSKLKLFTNDPKVQILWLLNENTELLITDGWVNSLKDSDIENLFINSLKSFEVSNEDFKNFLSFNNRLERALILLYLYNYKYQANSLNTYSMIENYDLNTQKSIKETSIFRVQAQVFPENEKKRLYSMFVNHNLNEDKVPDIVILNFTSFPFNISENKYTKMEKLNNLAIYKKNEIN